MRATALVHLRFTMGGRVVTASLVTALAIGTLTVWPRDQQDGQHLYESNCAGCHGLDARGGEHAPDIATRPRVQQMPDTELVRILRAGIPAAGMPAFGSRLDDKQLSALTAYLRILQREPKETPLAEDDETRGSATVIALDGRRYTGFVRNEDNFSIQLQSGDGAFYLFDKSRLQSITRDEGSGMPNSWIESKYASEDIAPNTDPNSSFWTGAAGIFADRGPFGSPVPGAGMEVRSRWTKKNLYLLFICKYRELHLRPDPTTHRETNALWNWDVAEAFIGSDFENIRRYKEFEVSPQGEWVDLDIDLTKPQHEEGWLWNSGFEVAARIDQGARMWYACMRIPYSSIDARTAQAGNALRINFYQSQGPPERRVQIAWQPTHSSSFHVPESFGVLKLIK
jgi:cytochrome c553